MNTGAAIHGAGSRAAAFDVLNVGRVGVDLYPLQFGTRLQDVETFGRFLGGSPTNVAVAAARHGRRAAVITRTGRDPFGVFVHQALRDLAVDDRYVSTLDGSPTAITFVRSFRPTTSRCTSTGARRPPTCRSRPRRSIWGPCALPGLTAPP